MHYLFAALLALSSPEVTDSLRTSDIEEVVIVSTPKENTRLRRQAVSSTSFSQADMTENAIAGICDLTSSVPNLFVPSYGSRLTTSVYIRGLGSRIGTPAVALYVDGLPQISPASYDFSFANVDRIDVLRGPQSTLYGRNSMGGVIRVYTKNPMHYQGTDITFDAGHDVARSDGGRKDGGGAGHYRLGLTHYHRISEQVAFTGHFFGEYDGGHFRNHGRGDELIDRLMDFGARWRMIYRPTDDLHFDLSASHEWLKQGGYPYEYVDSVGTTTTPDPALGPGHIAYNRRSGYRRNLTNVGLTAEKTWPKVTLTSITSYQHLHDGMNLDQDFTEHDLYTLTQRQNVNTITEEMLLKPSTTATIARQPEANHYEWLLGLSAIRQWNRTEAPVAFYADGLEWLNGLINRQANTHLPTVASRDEAGNAAYTMNFIFNNLIRGDELAFPGVYKTPTSEIALFHESSLKRLFGVEGLTFTAGLRADYEHFQLDYNTGYTFSQQYGLGGRLTYPDGSVREGMTLVPKRTFTVDSHYEDRVSRDYLKLLPRLTLQYAFTCGDQNPPSNVYATVTRGYRSGGYNIQMFNELLQGNMQTDIMHNVAEATVPVVDGVAMIPADVKGRVREMLIGMGTAQPIDVQGVTWYRPETSWSYEVGGHLNLCDARLSIDGALFAMATRDQQVSRMTTGGMGRVTVNSGRSRSLGAEASLRWRVTDELQLTATYGYTHAKFRDGGFVPFVPRNTLAIGATQRWALRSAWLEAISIHAGYHGAGRIYWTESNTAWQDFAGMADASVGFHKGGMDLHLYGHNILSTRYQTFYFETMQRGFAQYTRPAELGIQLRWHL